MSPFPVFLETDFPFPIVEILFRYFKSKFFYFIYLSGSIDQCRFSQEEGLGGIYLLDTGIGGFFICIHRSFGLILIGWKSSVFENKRNVLGQHRSDGDLPPLALKFQEEMFPEWTFLMSSDWMDLNRDLQILGWWRPVPPFFCAFGNLISKRPMSAWVVQSRMELRQRGP